MIDVEASVVISPPLQNVLVANPSRILAAPRRRPDSRWIVMIFHLAVVVRQSVRIFIKRQPCGQAHRRSSGHESCAASPACSRNLRILSLATTVATSLISPPHSSHFVTSILNTRARSFAQPSRALQPSTTKPFLTSGRSTISRRSFEWEARQPC